MLIADVINVAPPKVEVNVPDVIVPEIKIPEVKVPEINTDKLDASIKELASTLEKPTRDDPMPVELIYNKEVYKATGGSGGGIGSLALKIGDIAKDATVTKLVGEYTLLLDDVTTTNMTYVGKAAIGSATSSSVWQIKRIDESGTPTTLVVKWAGGAAAFDQVWDNRASLTYS